MEALPALRILLVEDDPLQSASTAAFLESLGQTVLLAANGEEAVSRFAAEGADIVLMDVVLPSIDGFEATRRIKALRPGHWVPVIYLTILGSSGSLVEGLDAGGDDYLVKPVGLEILEAKLRSVIRTLGLYHALETSRDELERSNAALRDANRELETFTYAVAHDLKSPLRAINGYTSLLAGTEAATLTGEGRVFLDKIIAGTEHMGLLIDDLLEYSRLERGLVHFEWIDVRRQVEALVAEFQDEIARTGATIAVDAACTAVEADRNGLLQALRNLIANALKFSSDGKAPRIEIGCVSDGDGYRICVRDNGIGFDMRHCDRIFDIFQRLHRSEEYPGTGIGLAIVRKAAQRMGGQCHAESAPGQGATFCIEWPKPVNVHPA